MRMVWSWRIGGGAVLLGSVSGPLPLANGHEHDLSEQCFPENGHGHALPNAHGHKMVMGMPSRMPHGKKMVMGMPGRMPHGQEMVMGMKTRMPHGQKMVMGILGRMHMVEKWSKNCLNIVKKCKKKWSAHENLAALKNKNGLHMKTSPSPLHKMVYPMKTSPPPSTKWSAL